MEGKIWIGYDVGGTDQFYSHYFYRYNTIIQNYRLQIIPIPTQVYLFTVRFRIRDRAFF